MGRRLATQQHQFVSPLGEAEEEREQTAAQQQPDGRPHVDGDCSRQETQDEECGDGEHIDDDDVLQPGAVQHVEHEVGQQNSGDVQSCDGAGREPHGA